MKELEGECDSVGLGWGRGLLCIFGFGWLELFYLLCVLFFIFVIICVIYGPLGMVVLLDVIIACYFCYNLLFCC